MKKILLLIAVFVITGCQANYTLSIDKEGYNESLTAIEKNSMNFDSVVGGISLYNYKDFYLEKEFPYHYNDPYLPEANYRFKDVSYYNVNDLTNDNQVGLSLSSKFKTVDSFSKSNIIWKTCHKKDISLNDGILSINASGFNFIGDYDILDKITVNIISDYNIVNSNADKINGNKYTWVITKSNYNGKSINIVFDTNSFSNRLLKQGDDSMVRFTIALSILSLVCFVLYFFTKKIFIRRNRF